MCYARVSRRVPAIPGIGRKPMPAQPDNSLDIAGRANYSVNCEMSRRYTVRCLLACPHACGGDLVPADALRGAA